MKQILKYWRLTEDRKFLRLLPSKEGIEVIRNAITKTKYKEVIEKIGKSDLIAFEVEFDSPIKYCKSEITTNEQLFYLFSEKNVQYYFKFSYQV